VPDGAACALCHRSFGRPWQGRRQPALPARSGFATAQPNIDGAWHRGSRVGPAALLIRLGQQDQDRLGVVPTAEASEGDDLAKKTEALLLFRRSRAAAALAFALSSDSEQLHEAVYEAIIASDDQAEAIRSAEMALKAT
jgi:hypothetical protein